MVSIEYAEAFSQVLYVLERMEYSLRGKIPENVVRVLKDNSLQDDNIKLDDTKKLKDMGLSTKACLVLAIIYLNCLCTSEEKLEYIKLLQENDKIYQDIENNQIGHDNIFSKNDEKANDNKIQNTDMIIHKKQSMFVKLINKIKKFFNLNRRD